MNTWGDVLSKEHTNSYNCEHFVVDVFAFLESVDISGVALTHGVAKPINMRNFKKIEKPTHHCFVLFRAKNKAHCGIWHNNAVLHLSLKGAVLQALSIASIGFDKVSYYDIKQ